MGLHAQEMAGKWHVMVKRKEQLQDKNEVMLLASPKIRFWVKQGCPQQSIAAVSVLRVCIKNVTQRTSRKRSHGHLPSWTGNGIGFLAFLAGV